MGIYCFMGIGFQLFKMKTVPEMDGGDDYTQHECA